jgi:hypothetical protein
MEESILNDNNGAEKWGTKQGKEIDEEIQPLCSGPWIVKVHESQGLSLPLNLVTFYLLMSYPRT